MKRQADSGRGDLTDDQWVKLQLCSLRKKHGQGDQHLIIVVCSMAFFGYTELVRRGETYQSVMVGTVTFPVDFICGALLESGRRFGKV